MPSDVNERIELAPNVADAQSILDSVETLFAQATESLYRARNEIRRTRCGGRDIVIKSFKPPRGLKGLIYGRLRESKARRSFHHSLRLQQLGFDVPGPIGYKERHVGAVLADSYYVSDYLEPLYRLEAVLHGNPADWEKQLPKRKQILQGLGELVAKLHKAGVLHRDLSPGNVLIQEIEGGGDGNVFRYALVDVNRMEFGPVTKERGLENFAMLWANDEDLDTIISGYAPCRGLDSRAALQRALHYSRQHKRRYARRERVKKGLRSVAALMTASKAGQE